jgi:ATP/maltotriose-dependent transcriptional regulator MalT
LGQALFRAESETGAIDSALALQDRLRETAMHVPGLGPDEFAMLDWEQVNLLAAAGRFDRALSVSSAVLPGCVEALGVQAQLCRYLAVKRAQMMLKVGKVDESLRALPALRAIADDPNLPFLQIEVRILELRLRSATAANVSDLKASFERVRQFGEAGGTASVQPALRAGALLGLAEACLRMGDAEQARAWISQALDLLAERGEQPAKSRTGANARMLMGIASVQQGQADEALAWLQRSQDYFAVSLGAEHPATQLVALNRSLALATLDRREEASEISKRAQPALQEAFGSDAPAYRRVVAWTHELEDSAGRWAGANNTSSVRSQRRQDVARLFFGG